MYPAEERLGGVRMKMARLIPGGLLLLAACSGFPYFGSKASEDRKASTAEDIAQSAQGGPHAVLELQHVQYDGGVLSGRLLVGALVDGLRLDKRLLPSFHVNADSVRDCEDREVPYLELDYRVRAASDEDLLILKRGYWYGGETRIRLFFEPGPDCINVELSLLSWEGRRVGSVRVRAERAPPHAVDAGLPEQPQPTDAGVP